MNKNPFLCAAYSVTALQKLKERKRLIIEQFATPTDHQGALQALTTIGLFILLWCVAVAGAQSQQWWITILASIGLVAFMLRSFVMLHECGHSSLFRSASLNRTFGFLFGVITGMPQYVWSQHHKFHHSTNGDWEKYRGPLDILSCHEYRALSATQKKRYARQRSVWMAPLGGLFYMIINPRINWIRGSARLLSFVARERSAKSTESISSLIERCPGRSWNNAAEYQHQSMNNLLLIPIWLAMAWAIGPALFFSLYFITGGLAGALGLILFTVQHNYEHASATKTADWDYDHAALYGTSYLMLPA